MQTRDVVVGELDRCNQCGVEAPAGANFCPECGTPRDVGLLDPWTSAVCTGPTEASTSMRSRLGVLAGLILLGGVVALAWMLTRDDTPVEDESADAPPQPTVPATTATPSSTTTPPTTTTEPSVRYVFATPGPVIEEGIHATIVIVGFESLYRIDLATGEFEFVQLETPVEPSDPNRAVLMEQDLVSVWEGGIVRTDLETGGQTTAMVEGIRFDAESDHLALVGQAGPDSVWVTTRLTAYEVGLAGEIRREVHPPEWFWITGGEGEVLHLEGPAGSYRYDVTTGSVLESKRPLELHPEATISCDEELECRIVVETDLGSVQLTGLSGSDFLDSIIRLSPDLSAALVHRWTDHGPELVHVDLVTTDRRSLGMIESDLWLGAAWIPDTRWVVLRSFEGDGLNLIAVNTETSEHIEIPPPRRRPADQDAWHYGAQLLLVEDVS